MLSALDASRCVCHEKGNLCKRPEFTAGHCLSAADVDQWAEVLEDFGPSPNPPSHVFPRGPAERVPITYSTSVCAQLRGALVHTADILQLKLGQAILDVHFEMYEDGFSICVINPEGDGERTNQLWSPFMMVEGCQVRASAKTKSIAVFKLSILSRDFLINSESEGSGAFYFAVSSDTDPEKERDAWVERIGQAIANLSQSLFPPHDIVVDPVPWVDSTSTRIMAGYLLRSVEGKGASLVYVELHANDKDTSKLRIYNDEWCEHDITTLTLKSSSIIGNRKGASCHLFGVDCELFSSRTKEETTLWMRALCNIKVKLMFEAPSATPEDLVVFRAAVGEKVGELEAPSTAWLPMLQQRERQPDVANPAGDVQMPEPIDDAAECSPSPAVAEAPSAEAQKPGASPGRAPGRGLPGAVGAGDDARLQMML